jgi:hypothetical protein
MINVEQCAVRIKNALTALPSIQRYAVDRAPEIGPTATRANRGGPLINRLFPKGIEIDRRLCVSVIFDLGDLDQLMMQLNDKGHAEAGFCAALAKQCTHLAALLGAQPNRTKAPPVGVISLPPGGISGGVTGGVERRRYPQESFQKV